jgi:hypothetical protein
MSCWGWREGKRGMVWHIRVKWRGIFEFRLWIYRVMEFSTLEYLLVGKYLYI